MLQPSSPITVSKVVSTNCKHLSTLSMFINPFNVGVPKDLLINISSGKAASERVEQFLLNFEKNGEMKRKSFIEECEADVNRFEKSLTRTPLLNFSADYLKKQ